MNKIQKKLFRLRRSAMKELDKLDKEIIKRVDLLMNIEAPKEKEAMPQMRATKRDNHLSLWISKEETKVFEEIKLLVRTRQDIPKEINLKFSEIIYRALKLGDFYHNE